MRTDSPTAVRTFVDRVDSAVKKLSRHPNMGRDVPELEKQNITIEPNSPRCNP
jgi:plasmid stabilization system protein ParE